MFPFLKNYKPNLILCYTYLILSQYLWNIIIIILSLCPCYYQYQKYLKEDQSVPVYQYQYQYVNTNILYISTEWLPIMLQKFTNCKMNLILGTSNHTNDIILLRVFVCVWSIINSNIMMCIYIRWPGFVRRSDFFFQCHRNDDWHTCVVAQLFFYYPSACECVIPMYMIYIYIYMYICV